LVIGFIDHLQIVTTGNYSAIASSYTAQFTTAFTESSRSAVSSQVDVPLLLGLSPRRLATTSHQISTLVTAVSGLSYKSKS
jgi:hypothetical protein